MPFPEVDRLIFNKNPLDQVICQVRFPAILSIDKDTPYLFQDKIRKDFPGFRELKEKRFSLPQELASIVPDEFAEELDQTSISNFQFSSEDGNWTVNLTRSFLAFTAKKYRRWEDFKEKLFVPINFLKEVYQIPYFARIGLRYVNVVRRSELGLIDVDWNELIRPYLLGVLSSPEVGKQTTEFECRYEIKLAEGDGSLRLITRSAMAIDTGELYFVIDGDFFYNNKIIPDSLENKLDYLNSRSTRLIQWAITDKLRDAMEPQPLV